MMAGMVSLDIRIPIKGIFFSIAQGMAYRQSQSRIPEKGETRKELLEIRDDVLVVSKGLGFGCSVFGELCGKRTVISGEEKIAHLALNRVS